MDGRRRTMEKKYPGSLLWLRHCCLLFRALLSAFLWLLWLEHCFVCFLWLLWQGLCCLRFILFHFLTFTRLGNAICFNGFNLWRPCPVTWHVLHTFHQETEVDRQGTISCTWLCRHRRRVNGEYWAVRTSCLKKKFTLYWLQHDSNLFWNHKW